MSSTAAARAFHGLTALVAAFALVAQVVLTTSRSATLVVVDPPGLAERLFHLVSYFTVLSNALVLDLSGWSYAVDKLLHVVVPLLAVLGWVLFGPRRRVTRRVVLLALVHPVAWLAFTLAVVALSGWYPYPFLDVGENRAPTVAVAALGIAVFLAGLSVLVWWLDRVLGPAPRPVLQAAA